MHFRLGMSLAILVLAASHVLAIPAAVLLHHERHVPSFPGGSSRPESSPHHRHDDRVDVAPLSRYAKELPGFNHKPVLTLPSGGAKANGTAVGGGGGGGGAATSEPVTVFGQKCRQLKLLSNGRRGQSTLQAACLDDDGEEAAGTWWLTSLNLNQCLGNDGGKLVFRERGNYDVTCRPCGIETEAVADGGLVWLRCACLREADGLSTFTELSLGQRYGSALGIEVADGRLVCGSHQGTKSPQFGTFAGSDGGRRVKLRQ